MYKKNFGINTLILFVFCALFFTGCSSKKKKKFDTTPQASSITPDQTSSTSNEVLEGISTPSFKVPTYVLGENSSHAKVTFLVEPSNDLLLEYPEFELGLYNIQIIYDGGTVESAYSDSAVSEVGFLNTLPLKLSKVPSGHLNLIDTFSFPSGEIASIRLIFSGTTSAIEMNDFVDGANYSNIDLYFNNYQTEKDSYRLLPYQVDFNVDMSFVSGQHKVIKLTVDKNISVANERFYKGNILPQERFIQFTPFFTAKEETASSYNVYLHGKSRITEKDGNFFVEEKAVKVTNLSSSTLDGLYDSLTNGRAHYFFIKGAYNVANDTVSATNFLVSKDKNNLKSLQEALLPSDDNSSSNEVELYISSSALDNIKMSDLIAADIGTDHVLDLSNSDLTVDVTTNMTGVDATCDKNVHHLGTSVAPDDCIGKKITGIKIPAGLSSGLFAIQKVQQHTLDTVDEQSTLIYDPSTILKYDTTDSFFTALSDSSAPLFFKIQARGSMVDDYFVVSDKVIVQLSSLNDYDKAFDFNKAEDVLAVQDVDENGKTLSLEAKIAIGTGIAAGVILAGVIAGVAYRLIYKKGSSNAKNGTNEFQPVEKEFSSETLRTELDNLNKKINDLNVYFADLDQGGPTVPLIEDEAEVNLKRTELSDALNRKSFLEKTLALTVETENLLKGLDKNNSDYEAKANTLRDNVEIKQFLVSERIDGIDSLLVIGVFEGEEGLALKRGLEAERALLVNELRLIDKNEFNVNHKVAKVKEDIDTPRRFKYDNILVSLALKQLGLTPTSTLVKLREKNTFLVDQLEKLDDSKDNVNKLNDELDDLELDLLASQRAGSAEAIASKQQEVNAKRLAIETANADVNSKQLAFDKNLQANKILEQRFGLIKQLDQQLADDNLTIDGIDKNITDTNNKITALEADIAAATTAGTSTVDLTANLNSEKQRLGYLTDEKTSLEGGEEITKSRRAALESEVTRYYNLNSDGIKSDLLAILSVAGINESDTDLDMIRKAELFGKQILDRTLFEDKSSEYRDINNVEEVRQAFALSEEFSRPGINLTEAEYIKKMFSDVGLLVTLDDNNQISSLTDLESSKSYVKSFEGSGFDDDFVSRNLASPELVFDRKSPIIQTTEDKVKLATIISNKWTDLDRFNVETGELIKTTFIDNMSRLYDDFGEALDGAIKIKGEILAKRYLDINAELTPEAYKVQVDSSYKNYLNTNNLPAPDSASRNLKMTNETKRKIQQADTAKQFLNLRYGRKSR